MNDKRTGRLILVAGLLVTAIGAIWIAAHKLQGTQPWGPLLSDNVIFAKALPFVIGLGVVVGLAHAWLDEGMVVEQRADGYIRRFSTATVLNHWINAIGFLLALVTGSVQYLTGVLDVPAPLPLYMFYRLHYIGATLVVFAVSSFVTHRLLIGDRRLLPERGRLFHELRGLVDELPRIIGAPLAMIVGLNLRRSAPPTKQFTFYERLVSFPIWTLLLTLLIATGLIKALRYVYPVPGSVVFWASTLHVTSMILLAAKLLDHLRYVLSSSRWPLLVAMFTGWVPEAYAREHHPAWHAELKATQSLEEPARAMSPRHGAARPADAQPGD